MCTNLPTDEHKRITNNILLKVGKATGFQGNPLTTIALTTYISQALADSSTKVTLPKNKEINRDCTGPKAMANLMAGAYNKAVKDIRTNPANKNVVFIESEE